MTNPDDSLVGLRRSLDSVAEILSLGRQRYDSDSFVRLALQRLWITIGNYAESYRLEVGLSDGAEPWTELYVYRCVLAHALPEELDSARVWDESVADIERIRSAVASAGGGISLMPEKQK